MMSATVDLPAASGGRSTFTLVRNDNLVDVYAGAPTSANFVTSVEVSASNPLALAALGGTANLVVDPSGGNPLPAGLVVTAGNIAINQDLAIAGAPVPVTVNSGAVLDFGTTEHLDGLTVQSGATANMQSAGGQTLNTTTLAVAGTLDLGNDSLAATAPTAANLSLVNGQLGAGSTLLHTAAQIGHGIFSARPTALLLDDTGELLAAPVTTNNPTTNPTTNPTAGPTTGQVTNDTPNTIPNGNGDLIMHVHADKSQPAGDPLKLGSLVLSPSDVSKPADTNRGATWTPDPNNLGSGTIIILAGNWSDDEDIRYTLKSTPPNPDWMAIGPDNTGITVKNQK